MNKKIIIDANFPSETRVILLDKNGNIENFEFSTDSKKQIKGNIYLAKISRIEPSLQAAFVDYGNDKSGFLPFSEIHPDYYQIMANEKSSENLVGNELQTAKITSDDLNDKANHSKFAQLTDSDDIDIHKIESFIEDQVNSDFDISAREDEIHPIDSVKPQSEKTYKIQEVIKKGQILLVQATKDERGNKGASFTSFISIAGKYCVLMPNKASQNGISRKISNSDERKRLKKIINELYSSAANKNFSIIARTAGAGHTSLEIKKDYDYLARLWNKIRETTLNSIAPSFIHQEEGILQKTIRDVFDKNVKEVIIQGKDAFNSCLKFVKDIMPNDVKLIKEYRNKTPIFTKYSIEEQLIKLYQPVVNLPSGGYIVINPTEALISIDVNSGRSTSERNIEETALKTNLEAAREIARQARLRDLSGLIVIDFIDLADQKNKRILERSLWEFFSRDKARIQTNPISSFGLLEISRQRLKPSFLEMNSSICYHCSGKGVVRADDANSMLILRTIENEIFNGNYDVVNVFGVASSIIYLLNNKRSEIDFVENKYKIKLNFYIDKDATADSYSIEKVKLSHKNREEKEVDQPAVRITSEIYKDEEQNYEETPKQLNPANKNKKNPNKKNNQPNVSPKEIEAQPVIEEKINNIHRKKPRKKIRKNFKKSKPNDIAKENLEVS